MGDRLTPSALKEFQRVLPDRINQAMDRGYEIFKNNAGQPRINGTVVMENYKPTQAIMNETAAQLIKIADDKGLQLSLQDAKLITEEIVKTAELPKGFKLNDSTGIIRANFPDFVLKSVADQVTDATRMDNALMSELKVLLVLL